MAFDPTDAVTARALLEDALALTSNPTLTIAQVDRAFGLASSLNAAGEVIYISADLDRAAAWGWNIKAGLTSDQYDLGGGSGKTLKRSQWQAACERIASKYGYGVWSVTGDVVTAGDTAGTVTTLHLNYLTDEYPYETTS